jgi:hypothetical protein
MASPAAAKCSRECKTLIKDTGRDGFLACRDACNNNPAITKKKDKKKCIKALCLPLKKRKTWKKACKQDAAPTVPSCGSPSGAFVDASLE